jgi:SAM-dependent methyltransferase
MEIINRGLFERLISDAMQQEFSGWDFSFLANRWKDGSTTWDYVQIVRDHIKPEIYMLDMDTGGGEVLSSLQPLPHLTYATEGYVPNVPIAKNRLEPLGVKIVQLWGNDLQPFEGGYFDLVANRHGSFSAKELYRIIKPGGLFITQQVGGENNFTLNQLLQEKPEFIYSYRTMNLVVKELVDAGFQILEQKEEFPEAVISDIGALVFHLKIISWQIADFSIEKYYDKLAGIHNLIQEQGGLKIKSHRFLIVAKKGE